MTGLLLAAALAMPASARVRHLAVVAANNEGSVIYRSLFFAEDDARKIGDLLVDVGGYDPDDVELVLGATKRRIQAAVENARRAVEDAHADGDQVVFLFYYSGHGDEDAMLTGDSTLPYDQLESLLDQTGADVKLAFLDACNSGAATRSKGGSRVAAFDVELAERLGATGTVIITSSSGDEASQESDEIGGSYFTHYLASGLYGAADDNGDQAVTLSEAYAYVYNETVLRTSTTRIGTQHPTYEWSLSGQGDLVLADLDPARGTLSFGPELDGSFAIFDTQRRVYIAEIAADLDPTRARLIHLPPGRYQVRRRLPSHLRVADVAISDGARVDVSSLEFRPLEYEDDVAKGAIDQRIRQARMPDSSVRVAAGILVAGGPTVRRSYLPSVPVMSASWRINWDDGRWLSVDLSGAVGSGVLDISAASQVPTSIGAATAGVGAGYATRPRLFQAGIGLRVDALLLGRAFDASQQVPDQSMTALAPGLDIWVGLHYRRFEAELATRSLLVPTALDEVTPVFTLHQGLLVLGYRF